MMFNSKYSFYRWCASIEIEQLKINRLLYSWYLYMDVWRYMYIIYHTHMYIYIYIYMYVYVYAIHHWSSFRKLSFGLSGIWTHNHWIPFIRSNRLSYQAMSSTRTQSQFCTASPISSFVQCHSSFRSLPLSLATFILIEIFLR